MMEHRRMGGDDDEKAFDCGNSVHSGHDSHIFPWDFHIRIPRDRVHGALLDRSRGGASVHPDSGVGIGFDKIIHTT